MSDVSFLYVKDMGMESISDRISKQNMAAASAGQIVANGVWPGHRSELQYAKTAEVLGLVDPAVKPLGEVATGAEILPPASA